MMDWPDITVLIVTYNRPRELQRTLAALRLCLIYPADKLHYLVADDCSDQQIDVAARVVQTPRNSGLGANANNGLLHVETDYAFQTQDDFVLKRDLNLMEAVALMEVEPRIAMTRYVGATMPLAASLKSADISPWLPGYGHGTFQPGKLHYWEINARETPYPCCDWPHLKHRRFVDYYGLYPEDQNIHNTEYFYGEHVRANSVYGSAPQIALMPDWVTFGGIEHIGETSWQGDVPHLIKREHTNGH